MTRYAEWHPTRLDVARHRARTLLRWPLRPLWRVLGRVERSPLLAPVWGRLSGPDYTGWQARALRGAGLLQPGDQGVVAGFDQRGRRRAYTVSFARTDLITSLPAPGDVELRPPAAS